MSLQRTLDYLPAAYPALWFITRALAYMGQVSFLMFFYLFPDGRFVPRWARWVGVTWAVLQVPTVFFPGSSLDVFSFPFVGGALFFGFVLFSVSVLVYRYRWVSGPVAEYH